MCLLKAFGDGLVMLVLGYAGMRFLEMPGKERELHDKVVARVLGAACWTLLVAYAVKVYE